MLGVSRQFLIKLLERGDIPHHLVGTHRRIYVRDLLAYKAKRDSNRRKVLDDLTRAEAEDGLYDLEPPGSHRVISTSRFSTPACRRPCRCATRCCASQRIRRSYIPKWSADIMRELRSTLQRMGYTPAQAERRIVAMESAFEDASVTGYECLVGAMTNDPKDRHVLAAAVAAAHTPSSRSM